MKTLIILNGECSDISYLKELACLYDKIVCADGGFFHATEANLQVDVVVGDFDSAELPSDVDSIVFPKEKDLSDAEIAIEYALEKFGEDITLTCSLGKRIDHQLFNLFLLVKYPFLRIEERNEVIFLCKEWDDFSEYENRTVSFMPVESANITLKNFKYNIHNYDIKIGETITLSNIAHKDASISVHSGKVIALVNKNVI